MIPGMAMIGINGQVANPPFIDILTDLSLTTNLELCLDAGDPASYTSGQKWLDTSGNGYDFMLGSETGSPSTGDEPTFNGSVGGKSASEYWGFDGGDFFRYDSANEAWSEPFHKNGGLGTLVGMMYYPSSPSGTIKIMGDALNSNNDAGFNVSTEAADDYMRYVVLLGTGGPNGLYAPSTTALDRGAWNFWGLSFKEDGGASGSFWNVNGTVDTFNGNITTPSAAAAGAILEIGAAGEGSEPLSNGSRLGVIAGFSTNLSQANVELIRTNIVGRYGL